MRRLLNTIAVASVLLSIACSNRQPSSVPVVRTESGHTITAAPALLLVGRVTDAAHILSDSDKANLTGRLQRLEQQTGHQMVIVTVPTLRGRDPADFARDLGNSWGIGRKGYNDGVLLLVAPNERKVRLAVGYGLEETLTHQICQQIIDQKMLPRFRKGDLSGAINAGTDAVIARLI